MIIHPLDFDPHQAELEPAVPNKQLRLEPKIGRGDEIAGLVLILIGGLFALGGLLAVARDWQTIWAAAAFLLGIGIIPGGWRTYNGESEEGG